MSSSLLPPYTYLFHFQIQSYIEFRLINDCVLIGLSSKGYASPGTMQVKTRQWAGYLSEVSTYDCSPKPSGLRPQSQLPLRHCPPWEVALRTNIVYLLHLLNKDIK